MKNEFDLSKIAANDTPHKLIKANFEGTAKDYEIRALTDGEKMNLTILLSNDRDVMRTRKLYTCLLSCGLDIDQRTAETLFDRATPEALRVGDEIFTFSRMFEESKAAEAEHAEKNSKAEA